MKNIKILSYGMLLILVSGVVGVIVVKNNTLTRKQNEKEKQIFVSSLMPKLNVNNLVSESNIVVVGTVKGANSFVTPSVVLKGEKEVRTDIKLAVDSFLLNSSLINDKIVVIENSGGEAGGIKMMVEDQMQFEVGHKYLVFLKKLDAENKYVVFGGNQGAYEIGADGAVGSNNDQQNIAAEVFGSKLNLDRLSGVIKSAKPEKIPGMK